MASILNRDKHLRSVIHRASNQLSHNFLRGNQPLTFPAMCFRKNDFFFVNVIEFLASVFKEHRARQGIDLDQRGS
jgi:hypothetical protein